MKDQWVGNLVVEDLSHGDIQARMELFVPNPDI